MDPQSSPPPDPDVVIGSKLRSLDESNGVSQSDVVNGDADGNTGDSAFMESQNGAGRDKAEILMGRQFLAGVSRDTFSRQEVYDGGTSMDRTNDHLNSTLLKNVANDSPQQDAVRVVTEERLDSVASVAERSSFEDSYVSRLAEDADQTDHDADTHPKNKLSRAAERRVYDGNFDHGGSNSIHSGISQESQNLVFDLESPGDHISLDAPSDLTVSKRSTDVSFGSHDTRENIGTENTSGLSDECVETRQTLKDELNMAPEESVSRSETAEDQTEHISKDELNVAPEASVVRSEIVEEADYFDTKELHSIPELKAYPKEGLPWAVPGGLTWDMEKWQSSPTFSPVALEGEEQFVQVSLKDFQADTHPERSSIGSSLLERIGLGLYGQVKSNDSSNVSTNHEQMARPIPLLERRGLATDNATLDSAAREKESREEGEKDSYSRETSMGRTLEDFMGSPVSQKSLNFSPKSFSSFNTSPFLFDGGSSFSSPVGSPLLQKGKAVLPNASPELMHLIDSAIQGSDPSSLEKLKRVVAEEEVQVQEEGENRVVDSPAKVVVDVLLAKIGGTGGLDEKENMAPRMMLSAGAAVVAGELIPSLPSEIGSKTGMSPRTRMVKGLVLVLKACTRNRAMCSAAGLLRVLLVASRAIFTSKTDNGSEYMDTWDAGPLLDVLEALGSHCLSVLDLREWLSTIADTVPTSKSLDLALTLERAMLGEETRGPSYTFEFDGESSGLLGPGESRWPFTNGYAFATWLYIESFADTIHTAATAAAIAAAAAAKTGKSSAMSAAAAASALAGEGTAHMPRLFSFLTADNQGIEAYFHGQFLVIESASAKGRKASLHFTYGFKPRRWYFVGLEHSHRQSLLGKTESELKLYVDGHLHESRPFEFPRVSKALAFCCVGTNPPPAMAGLQRRRRQCPLFAEMGPVYIFKEPIGLDKMARLAARGGDAVPSFGLGAGLPSFSTNEQAMALAEEAAELDTELGPRLHLLYHPKLLVGRSCPDASPAGQAGMHRRPAEILGHVHVAARVRPTEAMCAFAEGGPMSMLPLMIGGVDRESLQPAVSDLQITSSAAVLAAPILRMMSIALQHSGNTEELYQLHAPQLLAQLLGHLLCVPFFGDNGKTMLEQMRPDVRDEEIVAAVVSLAQAPKHNQSLKVQLYSNLLLDLKLWSRCSYGLQKKLLSSLADMVFTESSTLRAANAVQMLLDGCRRCYWIVPESDSIHLFAGGNSSRPVGELNALIDELLVIVELLTGSLRGPVASADVRCLIQFVLDCPQPNQVARVLHLLYRLVVQPNTSRAGIFAETFLANGGLEMLLTLLQREGEAGETPSYMPFLEREKQDSEKKIQPALDDLSSDGCMEEEIEGTPAERVVRTVTGSDTYGQPPFSLEDSDVAKVTEKQESLETGHRATGGVLMGRDLGGISLSIIADSAKNNFRNVDSGDGIMVGIVSLLGALAIGGHLKLSIVSSVPTPPSPASSMPVTPISGEGGHGLGVNAGVWLLYALQRAFQAAPKRLLTDSVYVTLLAAVVRSEAGSLTSDDRLNLYDSVHRFEHTQLLLALLRALPNASRPLQVRALQDILFLACTHSDSRSILTAMPEWPEWILEILISNYEVGSSKLPDVGAGFGGIEDLVYNFLIIMLEHSMRQKDGWKDVESTIHCAEWLAMIGGSSTGEQRQRREESLPVMKRKLLGGLLDFAARELQLQTQVVAAAAAGVAAGGLSPRTARAEAEAAAHLSMSLAENALVLLMLVEDHLRLQCQLFNSSQSSGSASSGPASPRSFMTTPSLLALGRTYSDGAENLGSRRFTSASDSGGLSLDVLASMADSNGQISTAAMERLTAAAAAEPYESVRCAFASYGSCGVELADGWKRRSRMWYGVGLPSKAASFGGGGGGWDAWMSVIEKNEHGEWVELPLVRKSICMLQALLLDESGHAVGGSGTSFGGGAGTGAGGMHVLQQLLDSDQPFFTMLRMVLLAMREEDRGDEAWSSGFARSQSIDGNLSSKGLHLDLHSSTCGNSADVTSRDKLALLSCVLSPLLAMPISESRRQRVLVAACILYSEVWHAVSADRKILRKHYVEMIVPPFTTLLRRWRPLLSGIHELTDADGQSPLAVEDRSLATDALPSEAALAMITPAWAAAFASPPAAMALAMAAAGAGGGDVTTSKGSHMKRESSVLERKSSRLRSFSNFQKSPEVPGKPVAVPKDKAGAKAAALAAARDQERAAKIGSGRGLGAVAMASSAQRRNSSDRERARRWNTSEAMHMAWTECSNLSTEAGWDISEKDFSATAPKLLGSLSSMVEIAWKMRLAEVDRRAMLAIADEHDQIVGSSSWRSLICRLLEMEALFGAVASQILNNQRVFWKLDFMENSLRMRKRLKRNYKGTDHHGAAADYQELQGHTEHNEAGIMETIKEADNSMVNTPLPPEAAKLLPEQAVFEEAFEDESLRSDAGDLEDRRDDKEQRLSISSKQSSADDHPPAPSVGPVSGVTQSTASALQSTVFPSTGAAQLVVAESNEKLLLEIAAAMVQPLRVSTGRFQVTTRRLIFVLDNLVHIDDIENEKTENYTQEKRSKDRAWPLSVLREVYSRRYLLRRSALELFMVDRSNYFFNFGTTEGRRKVYKAIVQSRPPFLNNIYAGTQRPEQLLKRTHLMERWARWEISNFEYLMQLNTLAGRSYNDITQYPLFPWILSDYSSKILDLDNPSVYRDLSKPIGALNPSRLEKIMERFENFDDPVIPPFHYGSHYSSAGTVLYYLVRLEPFTTLSIQLQGGKFDHADRMFGDMNSTWNGVLEDMSDVKELVPELFYMPEILINKNGIELGKTQKGEKLEDVKLPPWAASPVDFVQKHRAALESEHVSAHLHDWIDLIFGYKQRGKEAVSANNVFFYMTYEGTVDIDKITDPVLRKATQDQIAYFGQTPSQLLTSPHIRKRHLSEILHLQTIFRNPSAAQCYAVPWPERCNVPASVICTTHDLVVTVDMNAPACRTAVHKWQPHTPDGHGMPFHFQHGKAAANTGGGALIRMFSRQQGQGATEWQYPHATALASPGINSNTIVAVTQDAHLLTGGHADNSLKLVAAESARVLESASGHCSAITCLALSPDGSTLVTGSRDSTAMLWRIHSNSAASTSFSGGMSDPSLVAAAAAAVGSTADSVESNVSMDGRKRRIEGPLHVLRGHLDELTCCCINADLDIVVSCSRMRGVLLHSITRGRLIRQLPLQRVDYIKLSSQGTVIVWDKSTRNLLTFTINGIAIARTLLPASEGDVASIVVSSDGQHAVVGTTCSKLQQPDAKWHGSTLPESESLHYRSQQSPVCTCDRETDVHLEQCNVTSTDRADRNLPVPEKTSQERGEKRVVDPAPSIILFDLHTLVALHMFKLRKGQDVTALALNKDSTNLVVSTADGQLLVYTDPAMSIKVVDQMLRLGWQGDGLTGYIS